MSIRHVVTMAAVMLSAGAAHAGYSSNPYDREYCREFTQRIYVGGVSREGYGVSCLQPDGAWRMVAEPSIHRPRFEERVVYKYNERPYYPPRYAHTYYQPTSYFSIRIGDSDYRDHHRGRHHYRHHGWKHGHYKHGKHWNQGRHRWND